ncbi:MAG: phosphoribosylanthranilate isomerase [Desulfobacterales bacterium]|nr:phosphoribosylanthranilate isomerase [Desulfobacterales bacterium]
MGKNRIGGRPSPQIKVCGFTRVDEAEGSADLGVDAVGCVFYPPSPRNVTDERAREISMAVSPRVKVVGVFVDETFSGIMKKVDRCRLDGVQLHGKEPPELVSRLGREDLIVIKALFVDGAPSLENVHDYTASGYLVECAKGPLPGGNAIAWRWDLAREFGETHPLVLAGGLNPWNIYGAIMEAAPDAVDVSSGVESAPGRKDLEKIKEFVKAVHGFAFEPEDWKKVF